MPELLVDFITSIDGYGGAKGWPGWWGLEGPEYLTWLGEQPDYTLLMGANTYREMYGFTAQSLPSEEADSIDGLTRASKVVFSSTLEGPLPWANTRLISGDAVEAVRKMKQEGSSPLTTLGSVSLARSLLKAGLVDRFRVVVFPVITGATGAERIYDGYPDVAFDMVSTRIFDGKIQMLEGVPRILTAPPSVNNNP
jgi:dihydrofolate reductase